MLSEGILQGSIWGLILCISIGPVFFFLIQTSIKEGLKQAMILDIGIIGSDIFCLLIVYNGLGSIFQDPDYTRIFGLIGGAILIGFGLVPFLKKHETEQPDFNYNTHTSKLNLILKGFILNTTNPFVFLFWLGYVGVGIGKFKDEKAPLFAYFIATFFVVVVTDFIKAYSAGKIKRYMTPYRLMVLSKASGVAVAGFGIALIIRSLQ